MSNKANIEEDIKILKDLKDKKIHFSTSYFTTGTVQLDKKERKAIENILADREKYKTLYERALSDLVKAEKSKNDAYWNGYIDKQNEAVEICKICKYRVKANKYDGLVEKIKKDKDNLEFSRDLDADKGFGEDEEDMAVRRYIDTLKELLGE